MFYCRQHQLQRTDCPVWLCIPADSPENPFFTTLQVSGKILVDGGSPPKLTARREEGMPVTWEIRNGVLIVTLIGNYSFDEPIQAVAAAMADPGFRVGMSLLIDVRLSLVNPSSEATRKRAHWMASLHSSGFSSRYAIVVSAQPHQYGIGRMLATYLELEGLEMRIFTDLGEAWRWLSGGNASGAAGGKH
jgi:hypothetical protein